MTTPHADLDALADLLVGEATPEQAAHVAACLSCQASLTELTAADGLVRAALQSLPEPELPAELATRLASLVAAERAGAPATPQPSAPVAAIVTPLASRRQVRWLPAAGGIAAAAALIFGAVVFANGNGSSPDATTALAKQAALPTSSTGNDYTQDSVLLQSALPGLLTGDAPARSALASAPLVPGSPGVQPAPSSTGPASDTAGAELSVVDPLAALRDQTTLAGCLAGLSDDTDPGIPLALDYAQYQGTPALVVVLPTTKSGKVDVFVVGAACTQADADLLFFTRLTDPR